MTYLKYIDECNINFFISINIVVVDGKWLLFNTHNEKVMSTWFSPDHNPFTTFKNSLNWSCRWKNAGIIRRWFWLGKEWDGSQGNNHSSEMSCNWNIFSIRINWRHFHLKHLNGSLLQHENAHCKWKKNHSSFRLRFILKKYTSS